MVLFGSLARRETTPESDVDYLLVTNEGYPDADQLRDVDVEVREVFEAGLGLKPPGPTGMFGTWVTAAELYMRIGLEQDTNLTHSRRALLLLESDSIWGWDRHQQLVRNVLSRYLTDAADGSPARFLINDVLRYWRTLTVDYQAKKFHQGKWGLRYLKMAISRKLTVAGVLATALTADPDPDQLAAPLRRPALARLAALHDILGDKAREALIELLTCADTFAGRLADADFRERMEALASRADAQSDAEFVSMRDLARRVHDRLLTVFLDDPALAEASRRFLFF